ncbi:hypothetical protein NQ314_005591 [Rhamnusium bicolor]|uniref:N-acetyltransferase domain-containing protein n=1 Tax=Rhamnusium bicolor TaxID=1586634 RepID=A0AAV8ZG58_9CUCU|nr:hypothetical protein NQ314_005591 [Rhamnusium bicolor]
MIHLQYLKLLSNSYTSNVFNSWLNALFNEITFQLIILLSAFLFICFGVPLMYCVVSIPLVIISMYVIIYGTVLMKAAQVMYDKKPLMCLVAEAYEPFFLYEKSESCWYKIISDDEIDSEEINIDGCQRKIIGTVAVMKHFQRDDWAWLFRLAVEKRYRRKGVGLKLIRSRSKLVSRKSV